MTISQKFHDDTPAKIKDSKGLHLVTQSTPNGQAVQIHLEELKDAYGLDFALTVIDIGTNVQKSDWFLTLDPNGRIPLLIDQTSDGLFSSHETSAEMFYLSRNYDKDAKFHFTDPHEENQLEQWTFFWHGSGAPYQGNTGFFRRSQPDNQRAIDRFRNETLRVFDVLEIHLSGKYTGEAREYLAGAGKGKYSVADIKTWPWVKGWERSGFTKEEFDQFPSVLKWIDRIAARPAVQRGIGEKYAVDGEHALSSK